APCYHNHIHRCRTMLSQSHSSQSHSSLSHHAITITIIAIAFIAVAPRNHNRCHTTCTFCDKQAETPSTGVCRPSLLYNPHFFSYFFINGKCIVQHFLRMCSCWHISHTPCSSWYSREYNGFCIYARFIHFLAELLCGLFFTDNTRCNRCFTMTNTESELLEPFFQVIAIFPKFLIQFRTFHQQFDRFFTCCCIRG